MRGQHEKAVLYLQRALRLNPNYCYAWTIMGHENIEMKNANAAIACYRKATGRFLRCVSRNGHSFAVPWNRFPFFCLLRTRGLCFGYHNNLTEITLDLSFLN